jgi:hypothetical protein
MTLGTGFSATKGDAAYAQTNSRGEWKTQPTAGNTGTTFTLAAGTGNWITGVMTLHP